MPAMAAPTPAPSAPPALHESSQPIIARAVRDQLQERGIDVALTRDGDTTLTLRQRVADANRRGADLFISVHANASPTRVQRGFETFVLTPAGVDVDGRALRSESGTPRRGVDAATAPCSTTSSAAPAGGKPPARAAVQRELRAIRGAGGNRGVRQDAHHVLLGATMPAVLVGVGFIDTHRGQGAGASGSRPRSPAR
jgi:N-acetylmuramoyl-L-alanine amidase